MTWKHSQTVLLEILLVVSSKNDIHSRELATGTEKNIFLSSTFSGENLRPMSTTLLYKILLLWCFSSFLKLLLAMWSESSGDLQQVIHFQIVSFNFQPSHRLLHHWNANLRSIENGFLFSFPLAWIFTRFRFQFDN
jgi:hypothetical protein